MGFKTSEKVFDALIRQIPLKRFGKKAEIVGLVLLLSSDASAYTTGTVIPVDGGYLA